ncbi:MAG: HD domain-containing phosphohydrolase [Bdellovibrionia bacterium]
MPSILIADHDSKFLKVLGEDPLARNYPIVIASSPASAQAKLAKDLTIASVFINVGISTTSSILNAYSVVRFSRTMRPKIPVFLIDETRQTEFSQELKKMGISGVLDKNVSYATLVSLSGLNALHFDEKQVLTASTLSEEIDKEIAASDQDFFPIRASDFLSGSTVLFELYVRIRSGYYIKILRSGDSFSSDRLKNYLDKGLKFFYMRNAVREHYLAYCQKISGKIAQSEVIDPLVKASQAMNFGEETLNFLRHNGLSERNVQYAKTYVSHVRKVVSELPIKDSIALTKFMDNLTNFNHGVSTSMLAGLIANQMQIESEPAVQIIGVAALFHDVGFVNMSENVSSEDTTKMSSEELTLFNQHPAIGHKILSEIRGMHPSVLQATLQHHQRRTQGARSTTSRLISRVSEIVGISDEFMRIIQKSISRKTDEEAIDPFTEMKKEFSNFSPQIVDAFQKAFIEISPNPKAGIKKE